MGGHAPSAIQEVAAEAAKTSHSTVHTETEVIRAKLKELVQARKELSNARAATARATVREHPASYHDPA